jgi:hypothetical protein
MNWEPNRLTVSGGTPRRVHSRPKAATALGWARKVSIQLPAGGMVWFR